MHAANAQVEVMPLSSTGVVFEPLTPAYLYSKTWTVYTQIRTTQEEEALGFIQMCELTMERLCQLQNSTEEKNSCKAWETELDRQIKLIKDRLVDINFYEQVRKRRGIANFVGRASNFLFGTMDDRDAHEIHEKLNLLESQNKENIHLMDKQVTLVRSKFSEINQALLNISSYQESLRERFNEFLERVHVTTAGIKAELRAVHIKADINGILIYILHQFQQIYQRLTNEFTIINALHQHTLHPLILTASDIGQIYQEIKSKNIQNILLDFKFVSQMIQTDSVQEGNNHLIRIILPLPENTKYTLNKIYLLPTLFASKRSTILNIGASYFLNDTQNHRYLELSATDFSEHCKKSTATSYAIHICLQTQPKKVKDSRPDCLLSLFNNPLPEPARCEHRVLENSEDYLTRMVGQNSWLFVFTQEKTLSANCSNQFKHIALQGTGRFTLIQPCEYTIDEYSIPFESSIGSYLSVHQPAPYNFPKIQISPLLQKSLEEKNNTMGLRIQHHGNHNIALISGSQDLQSLQNELEQTMAKRERGKFEMQTYANTGGIVVLVVALIVFAIFKYLRRKSKPKMPIITPKVRSSSPRANQGNPKPEILVLRPINQAATPDQRGPLNNNEIIRDKEANPEIQTKNLSIPEENAAAQDQNFANLQSHIESKKQYLYQV